MIETSVKSKRSGESVRRDEMRDVAKWSREYGQSRSLGVVVSILIFVALSGGIGGSSYWAGMAYRSGEMVWFGVAIGVLVLMMGLLTYMSVPRWGGKWQERMAERLYAKEGSVGFESTSGRGKVWGPVLAGCFGTCVLGSVVMGMVFDIPSKYNQPISALYVVPFLVGLWFLMKPTVGWASWARLIWPVMYAAHALLILAGAPILFTGKWEGLNMMVPIAGYGILAGMVGHVWSRIALGRLKGLLRGVAYEVKELDEMEEGDEHED